LPEKALKFTRRRESRINEQVKRAQVKLFEDFDFTELDSPEFLEDSVREVLVLPILKALGYKTRGPHKIIRGRALKHPFVKIGSTNREVTIRPDYLLESHGKPLWVLDAKGPCEEIKSGTHPDQVYSYAIHPEVRATYFALCNGREFIVFLVNQELPILCFQLAEIENYWPRLLEFLGTKAPSTGTPLSEPTPAAFDYLVKKLPSEIAKVKRQEVSRHYGVHGYFTKQGWNVVQEYIRNFSQPGDLVLDPFGGSGVTVIEALILGRRGIHVDINPHSIFLVENLVSPVNLQKLSNAYEEIRTEFLKSVPNSKKEIEEREKGVSQHILTDETGSRQGHFFGFAFLHRGHARNGAADRLESQGRRQRLIGLTSGRDPRRLWPGGR
jgi:DNA methylase/Type I restriction enzyme R protein N terminus (HSDR_N)